MKNRPTWSANGFAKRVKMSEYDLWLIVEGRDHDRPHYDKLFKALPSTRELKVCIRLVEQIDIEEKSAGGKPKVLQLHDHLEHENMLTTKNKLGKSSILFMVDRDRDSFLGTMRDSKHVFYTYSNDVEAEILLNADLWSAIGSAYGIDTSLTDKIRNEVPSPPKQLLDLWNEWLKISLVALECNVPGHAPWSKVSSVNGSSFEETDPSKVEETLRKIESKVEQNLYTTAYKKASSHVSNEGLRLIKGRWLAHYINYLVKTILSDEILKASVKPDTVIDVALATVSYNDSWTKRYDEQISKILSKSIPEINDNQG